LIRPGDVPIQHRPAFLLSQRATTLLSQRTATGPIIETIA